jgi:hypothetical protein
MSLFVCQLLNICFGFYKFVSLSLLIFEKEKEHFNNFTVFETETIFPTMSSNQRNQIYPYLKIKDWRYLNKTGQTKILIKII